jgi:hypothetical protein
MTRRYQDFTPSYLDFHCSVSKNNVNFFTDAGSPAYGNWNIIVDKGVILGSTSTGTAAATTGVFPGALKITVLGRIQGKGGDGGQGLLTVSKVSIAGGGGGGGAGTQVGSGGDSDPNGTDGFPGTPTSGGAGGSSGSQVGSLERNFGAGRSGGPALSLSMSAFVAAGEIWGGGGGGAGSLSPITTGSGGGGPGLAGVGLNGGPAGKAVVLNGNVVAWISQTDVRGEVS